MNLADAIRQAALRQAEEQGTKETPMSHEPNIPEGTGHVPPQPAATSAEAHATEPRTEPAGFDTEPPEAQDTWGNETGKLTITADSSQTNPFFAADSGTGEPVPMPEAPGGISGGNAVRFEIFLSPEQLSCLFRALVSTQHSMMTLREAANYLRIPAATLEQLAAESKIPALQLEGRWRFPKSGIDEWVMLQSFRDGEVNDAA